MSKWRHRDEWKRDGKGFCIAVSRHDGARFEGGEFSDVIPENRWCLYAYIYPKHPHFKMFKGEDMFQDATLFFDWHCGCTYVRQHVSADGDALSVQVGCDYNHLHDDRFLDMKTPEEAFEVFRDADALFACLEGLGAKQ